MGDSLLIYHWNSVSTTHHYAQRQNKDFQFSTTHSTHTNATASTWSTHPVRRRQWRCLAAEPAAPGRRPVGAAAQRPCHGVALSWLPTWRALHARWGRGRDTLEFYSTTIRQLQGPQLRSYRLALSHTPLLLPSLTPPPPPPPHILTHSPLRASSLTSVLPLQARQWGSSCSEAGSVRNDRNNMRQ